MDDDVELTILIVTLGRILRIDEGISQTRGGDSGATVQFAPIHYLSVRILDQFTDILDVHPFVVADKHLRIACSITA